MATEEDIKRDQGEGSSPQDEAVPAHEAVPAPEPDDASSPDDAAAPAEEHHDVAPVGVASPSQLGAKRFVYAAYFAGAIGIAFLMSKVLGFAWLKLQSWKPVVGEPRDEVLMPLSALIGAGAAVYYWYRTRARELAEEVAAEMSKVTWPTRTEVTNGTFVVIVTTVVSTVFFALMDRFWGFLTNLVYGGS
jgi:preprotein translocase subunit SecE